MHITQLVPVSSQKSADLPDSPARCVFCRVAPPLRWRGMNCVGFSEQNGGIISWSPGERGLEGTVAQADKKNVENLASRAAGGVQMGCFSASSCVNFF